MRETVHISVILALLLCLPGVVRAIDTAQDGDWDENATWSGGTQPTYGDDAVILDTHEVTLTTVEACKKLTVQSDGELTISGATLEGTNIYVYGAVTQDSGTVTFSGVGNQESYFAGTNSGGYVMNGGVLSVGYGTEFGGYRGSAGEGLLTVNGGAVSFYTLNLSYGGHGHIKVAGGAATNTGLLRIGQKAGSWGQLTVESGSYHAGGDVYVAPTLGGTGEITQTGGDVTISASEHWYIGDVGVGLYKMSGGTFTSGDGNDYFIAGDGAGSEGYLVLTNSAFMSHSGYFRIGNYGTGTMHVYDATFTNTTGGNIGMYAGASGSVHVADGGTVVFQSGTLQVGGSGVGRLYITGGEVRNLRMYLGANADCYGEVNISGGKYTHLGLYYEIGGSGGGANTATGVVIQTGGTNDVKGEDAGGGDMWIGRYGKGWYNMYGGKLIVDGITIPNSGGDYGEFNIYGGTVTAGSFTVTGGEGPGYVNQSGGSLGISGEFHVDGGAYPGSYAISGGSLSAAAWRMGTGTGTATFTVSGGIIDFSAAQYCYYDPGKTIHILGSDCTGFTIGDTWDYDDGDALTNTLRATPDDGGITTIEVDGNVDLRNVLFQMGPTNVFNDVAGTSYEFIRVPEANTIYTNGWAIENLGPTVWFDAYVTNYSSYDWLVINCVTGALVVKADNTNNLEDGSSWVSGSVPTNTDQIAIWDSTVTSANNSLFDTNMTWYGIMITDPGGDITISQPVTNGKTLTLGAAGIDMSSAVYDLTVNPHVLLKTDQTWTMTTSRTLTIRPLNDILETANNGLGKMDFADNTLTISRSGGGGNVTFYGAQFHSSDGTLIYTNGVGGNISRSQGSIQNVIIRSGSQVILGGGDIGGVIGNIDAGMTVSNETILSGGILNYGSRSAWSTYKLILSGGYLQQDSGAGAGGSGTMTIGAGGAEIIQPSSGAYTAWGIVDTVNSDREAHVNLGGDLVFVGDADNTNSVLIDLLVTNSIGPGSFVLTDNRAFNIGDGGAEVDLIIEPAIDGAYAVTKTGAGTLEVHGGHGTYSGGITVDDGTLLVCNTTNSGTGTGAVTINSGATLGGTGSITGNVTIASGATLAPGRLSNGTLTCGSNVTLNATSALTWELGVPWEYDGGNLPTTNDLVKVVGDLTLDGMLTVSNLTGFTDGTYTLIIYEGTLTDNTLEIDTDSLPESVNTSEISIDAGNKAVNLTISSSHGSMFKIF